MSWLFTQPPAPPPPPRMEGASSSALAAGGDYARVRLRLTGKLTPLRRRSSAPSDGGSASSSSTDIEEEEAELRGLLDAAVARAEQENSWLRSHDAWARVVGLLPLLTEAQGLLLTSERSRCLVEEGAGLAEPLQPGHAPRRPRAACRPTEGSGRKLHAHAACAGAQRAGRRAARGEREPADGTYEARGRLVRRRL